ncbi:5-formyltetrahydrofolate cyclo-ligase [Massilia sp. ST3]|uniref:5-formyltetrahydrofolate cyclo-ligase n=1 Tax=Massilia sp. ST3 TaxID=2824903 RepID=UPI001B827820|nr:5-formyltetrahydrofolate cyclo-ligase [Massilia sp. ST3]MBQ5948843.1 5-formyltetrahydrofolate cyclo-ligase [Massilia sp. ST3]
MTGDSRIPRASGALPDGTEVITSADDLLQQDKSALRSALKARRRAIDHATRLAWDDRIGAQVLAWWQADPQAMLGVYWPLAGEPDLRPAYAELAQAGVRLALPVVLARDAALGFAEWIPGEPTVTDRLGVAVPAELRLVARPPALLVPCLGFNAQGYRLGYGGGFYDRTLEAQPRPRTLGIAYACQLAEFAGDVHDVPLDRVITEET